MTGGPFLVKKVVTLQTLNGLFVELVYNRSSDDESRGEMDKAFGKSCRCRISGVTRHVSVHARLPLQP